MTAKKQPPPALRNLTLGVDVFTAGQVSRLFGISSRSVQKWCDSGRIQCARLPDGDRRVYRCDLLAFARRHGLHLPLSTPSRAETALTGRPGDLLPVAVGALAAGRELASLVIGCADGMAAAVALARGVRVIDPTVRLGMALPDDRPAVAAGVFDAVFDPGSPFEWLPVVE